VSHPEAGSSHAGSGRLCLRTKANVGTVIRSPMLTRPVVQFVVLLATATLLAGCLSSPPREQHLAYGSEAGAPAERLRLVRIADAQIGSPYVYGGNRPGGFDCSGLVQFSHARAGISVPRTTTEQWRTATPLERSYLLPGDILFFSLGGRKPRHVGIYEGDGRFIHAPSSGKTVSRASLDNPYWQSRWIGARTFL